MRIIGITGGVGSGKSRILSHLNDKYDAFVCQADEVAWKFQEPGQDSYHEIVKYFGNCILNEDETINRKELGKIVFSDESKMKRLNQIIHPRVKDYIKKQIEIEKEKGPDIFVIEAALLLEDNYDEICTETWYIFVNELERRKRLKESRGYSDEKINAIMKTQLSEDVFKEKCNVVLDNSRDFSYTCEQIKEYM